MEKRDGRTKWYNWVKLTMVNEKYNNKVIYAVIIIVYTVVLAFCWNRQYYGVEISDEAFYVAEAYIISNGAIPFTTNYSVVGGSFLLSSPFVRIFTTITRGTEGIYLFMRQAFLVFKLLVSFVLVILFKRVFPFKLALLLPLPYFAWSPYSLNSFSYNTISLSLLLICCTMLLAAFQKYEKYSKQFSLASGVLMAITILSHPLNLYTAAYVFILIVVIERIYFKTSIRSYLFIIGGIIAAIIITTYLAIISGGIKPIYDGIATTLRERPRNHQISLGHVYNSEVLMEMWHIFGVFAFSAGIAFFVVFVLYILRKPRIKRNDVKTICAISMFLAQILNAVVLIYRYTNANALTDNANALTDNANALTDNVSALTDNANALTDCISISGMYIVVWLLFICGYKKHITTALLLLTPFVVNYLYYLSQPHGLIGRGYILIPSVIVCIALTYIALENTHMSPLEGAKKTTAICAGSVLLTAIICTACIVNFYNYVYRDEPIHALTYKMESGVFKGLYTLKERGESLIFLEQEIQKVTDDHDVVLFRDQSPQAYLMTSANHCAPSTWDSLQYSYGYYNLFYESYDATNDFLLQEYFRAVGREPNKIIYVQDRERLEHISLWDEEFLFTQYVKRNYSQIYANNAEQFGIIVFERNP